MIEEEHKMRSSSHLKDVVALGERVECGVHGVEQRNDLHGGEVVADAREAHHVRHEYCRALERLRIRNAKLELAEHLSH